MSPIIIRMGQFFSAERNVEKLAITLLEVARS
jgi:hypothetical protein